jgi:hypothetical protein
MQVCLPGSMSSIQCRPVENQEWTEVHCIRLFAIIGSRGCFTAHVKLCKTMSARQPWVHNMMQRWYVLQHAVTPFAHCQDRKNARNTCLACNHIP